MHSISLGAFFPVYLNLSAAVREVDPKLIEVGSGLYRLNSFEMIRKAYSSRGLAAIYRRPSQRTGLGMDVCCGRGTSGLQQRHRSYLMVDGQMTGRAGIIFASIILFAACGKVTDWIANVVGDTTLGHRAR